MLLCVMWIIQVRYIDVIKELSELGTNIPIEKNNARTSIKLRNIVFIPPLHHSKSIVRFVTLVTKKKIRVRMQFIK